MSSETSRSRTTWWPASVVTVVVLIDQIDTNLVAGALPYLQREWGFGDTAAGAIPTSVAVAALLLALPAGHLADRVVRTRMISTAVAWWSLITTVSALAVSFPVFFATRVVLAGADSIYGPAASSLLADYYEPERRGRVFASYSLAGFVGLGAGVAIGGVLSAALGWRSAFLATVVPGLAVSLLVRRLHEPGRGTSDRVPSSGAAVPPSGGSDARFVPRLREVARLAVVRRLMLAIALVFLGVSGVFFWLKTPLRASQRR
jgi:MFS family permease